MAFGTSIPVIPESPYEPIAVVGAVAGAVSNMNGTLALKEEPSQNDDVKVIMARYKQNSEFDRIPSMPTEQRRKLMEYYKKAKEAGVKDRLIATGMGSIVLGYSNIEAVRTFVQEYHKTGKMGKHLPLPYVSFTNAAEKFPEAQILFSSELESTKKMDEQIKTILDSIAADSDKRSADAKKQAEEYRQSIKILEKLLGAIK